MGTVTTAALPEISGLVGNSGSKTAFTYLATGTGTGAESASDTALVTEITDSGLERSTGTLTLEDTTHTDDTLQIVKTWTATGTKTVAEVGMFNGASGGTMAFREKLATAKSLVSGDTYTLTAQLIFVDA